MKFIAHDHHNNNAYVIDEFKSPVSCMVFGEADLTITDAGICFFTLNKRWDSRIAANLNLPSAPVSRRRQPRNQIVREMISIPNQNADHVLGEDFFISPSNAASQLVEIVSPSDEDRFEPPEGWEYLEAKLKKLHQEAETETAAALGKPLRYQPSRSAPRFQL